MYLGWLFDTQHNFTTVRFTYNKSKDIFKKNVSIYLQISDIFTVVVFIAVNIEHWKQVRFHRIHPQNERFFFLLHDTYFKNKAVTIKSLKSL